MDYSLLTSVTVFAWCNSCSRWAKPTLLLLHISTSKNARHVVQHIRRALIVVAKVANQPALDHVDLGLGILIDDLRNQAGQLDRVLLVLEQLELQGLVQPFVRLV